MPVEILFCDRCHESIPDADLETGRAVRVGGRVLHVPCAFRRAMPGAGAVLTFLLALAAAGGVTFLAVRHFTVDAKPKASADAVVAKADVLAAIEALRDEMKQARAEDGKRLDDGLKDATSRLDDAVATKIAPDHDALMKLRGAIEGDRESTTRRIEAIERRLAELSTFVEEVRALARTSRDPGSNTEPPAPPTAPSAAAAPPPAPPAATAPAAAPAPDPEAQRRHDAELEKWVKLLKDPEPGISFSATYKLKDLRDLRAVPPLVDTLRAHKDYYTRLGAATALGELKACDAVPQLIEALDDKEELVQTAAGEALAAITGRASDPIVGKSKKERRQAKDEWSHWWKDNEGAVRARVNQPPMK